MNERTTGGIDGGRIVIALGGVILLVALFLDWYGAGRGLGDDAISAWTTFELVDVLLALLALAAIAAAIEPMVRGESTLPERIGGAAGPVALVLVLVSIIDKPPLLQAVEVELEVGAWLALAGAAIMCAGALLTLNRVSLVVTPRDLSSHPPRDPAPGSDPGELDTRASETKTRPLPPGAGRQA